MEPSSSQADPVPPSGDSTDPSPFLQRSGAPSHTPRSAEPLRVETDEQAVPDDDPVGLKLPPVKNIAKLRLAASDMIEIGIPLDEAASLHEVDADSLHVYYRTYVNTYGRGNIETAGEFGKRSAPDFDRDSHRQFDRNWAEMTYQAERDRVQRSPMRRRLISSPFTSWMFNGEVVDKIAVLGFVCVIGFGLLAVSKTRKASTIPEPVDEQPLVPVEGHLVDDFEALSKGQRREFGDRIYGFLGRFASLETWQERLPYARAVDGLESKMEHYYESHPDQVIAPIEVDQGLSFLRRDDGRFVLISGRRKLPEGRGEPLVFLIEMTDEENEFRIDWEVLTNYEPVSWEEFRAAKSREPAPFRVRLLPGNYYNQPFMDEEAYLSFKISFLYRPLVEVFGFVPQGSELAEEIARSIATNPGKAHAMTLNLRFPEGAKFDNVVEIDSVVFDRW